MKQIATMILTVILCAGTVSAGAEEWASAFEDPERDIWQKPRLVIDLMGLEKGEKAAAIGTDSGLFVRWLSRMTGTSGTVYFISRDKGALEYLRNLDDPALYDNIITLLAGPQDPTLPDGVLDHLLLVDDLGEIPNRAPYFKKLARALKPTGRLTIIDWQLGDLPNAPPPGKRTGRDQIVNELTGAGWSLITESVGLPYQYLLIFHPPGAEE